ncbi:MAG: thioredoxin domain-containing protein [Gammaproteobacteria bacterium]|nr:thioredoxin domain-containing protein [Gammaproteobacteria bacterium]
MTKLADTTNALIDETSPYLLQHAHNPVAWWPWNEAALAQAQRTGKPILLSIGYSACHWCHVMAHESFEDEDVAAVMNALYVCIKVDREERPDLDRIYQSAHSLLTQRPGGWPLTMFLAPDDLVPFFGGTYFPKSARYGLPAFPDLLRRVADFYREHKDELAEQAGRLRQALAQSAASPDHRAGPLKQEPIAAAVRELKNQFDAADGGFGGAPKFPHPGSLRRLLLAATGAQDTQAQSMVAASLRAMSSRGLYDHLEGGFFRYCVDAQWRIPHFEKMLYDNAQLIPLCAEGFRLTGEARLRDAALASAIWVMREMQAPDGGYYATLDADSDGHEGAFYVWTREEVEALVGAQDYPLVAAYFGLDGPPNFEGRSHHLQMVRDVAGAEPVLGTAADAAAATLARARATLLARRAARVRPGRDEKILTAWNALMIKGLARAGRLLQAPALTASARRALSFIQTTLWDGERLASGTKDGRNSPYGYLDDYAFLIDGILELLMTQWRSEDLRFAQALTDTLIDDFYDPNGGGFYFTAHGHERLIYRPKPFADDALPAGNGVAACTLLRMSHLTGDARLADIAEATIRAGFADLSGYPSGHCAMLEALEDWLDPPPLLIVRGTADAAAHWQAMAEERFAPRRAVYAIPDGAPDLPPGLAARTLRGALTAYACRGFACDTPVTTDADYRALLGRLS